ncbi:MAG: type II secretion system protein J [Limisphaerales bacterium]
MKLPPTKSRKCSGILLIQCLVYLAVFAILLTGAMTVLYFCWNHSEALIGATEQIHSALYTGERWRDDVRGATGKISMETTATGETVTIPEGKGDVRYYFGSGQVSRQSGDVKATVLSKVKTSEMKTDARGNVTAWRWELELTPLRSESHLPLLFTFEAVPAKP